MTRTPDMSDSRPIITVDLDSTLCDTTHRQHMIPLDPELRASYDWSVYSAACAEDTPFNAAIQLVRMLVPMYPILIVSGRREVAREATEKWLDRHLQVPYIGVDLDKWTWTGGHREYKVWRLAELRKSHNIVMHIDDHQTVRYAVEKELGIPVLCITPAYDDEKLALNPSIAR